MRWNDEEHFVKENTQDEPTRAINLTYWSALLSGGVSRKKRPQTQNGLAAALSNFLETWQQAQDTPGEVRPQKKHRTNAAQSEEGGSLLMQLQRLLEGCAQKKVSDATVAQELTSLLRQWQRGQTVSRAWNDSQAGKSDPKRSAAQMQSFYSQDSKKRHVVTGHTQATGETRTMPPVTGFAVGEWTVTPKVVSPNAVLKALG